MGHPKESLVFENNKVLITRDKWNWIVREKPIDKKNPYKKATYINDGNNLFWEVCDCRKLCEVGSGMAKDILRAQRAVQ